MRLLMLSSKLALTAFLSHKPAYDARLQREFGARRPHENHARNLPVNASATTPNKITDSQRNPEGSPITDCFGKPNALADNIEGGDLMLGFLAEPVRPHGFAISETQFLASRRLFGDSLLTSSLRPQYYTTLGLEWGRTTGEPQIEKGTPDGRQQPVSKRVLLRAIPELEAELDPAVNVFDPWGPRGQYDCFDWAPAQRGIGRRFSSSTPRSCPP